MPIDTAPKRRGSIPTRRLPWFRRFYLPAPDGTVSQADRQQLAFVYYGNPTAAVTIAYPSDQSTISKSGLDSATISKSGLDSATIAQRTS